MTNRLSAAPAFVACGVVAVLAVDGDKAMYVGGTVPGVSEKAEGTFSTKSESAVAFDAGKKGSATIPYAAITDREYRQKAGRRVAVAVLVSPLALFSKKRNHYGQGTGRRLRTREGHRADHVESARGSHGERDHASGRGGVQAVQDTQGMQRKMTRARAQAL